MKTLTAFLAVLLLALCATGARASTITFTLTGVPGISGYVQYDSSSFYAPGFLVVPNNQIVGLSLDVFGYTFDLADVFYFPGFSAAIIDNSGPQPLIVNGFGLFAYDGFAGAAFYPDGSNGTPMDGDAALSFQPPGASFTYAVRWVAAAAPEPAPLALVAIVALAAWPLVRRPTR